MGAEFTSGEGAWCVLDRLAAVLEDPPTGEEQGEAPVWKHHDVDLEYPTKCMVAEDIQGAWVLHFDGGCRRKSGSGGFIL